MSRIKHARPALFIAVLALIAAVAGSAFAGSGPDANTAGAAKKALKKAKKALKESKQNKNAIANIELTPGPQGDRGPSGSDANAVQFVSGQDISGTATRYLPVSGWIDGGAVSGPHARAAAPRDFVVRDFTVRLNAAVQASNSRTFSFARNGTKTAVSCTVSPTEGGCTSAASVAVTAGDTVQIVSEVTGSPNPNGVFIGWRAADS